MRTARFLVAKQQRGATLAIVMIILVVSSALGVAATHISLAAERAARNDRDSQVAWQAAEAALIDAEMDIFGPGPSPRRDLFGSSPDLSMFMPGCGDSGNSLGLCATASATGKPAWLSVDYEERGATLGQFTARTFQAGGLGAQPAMVPRYVIEPLLDPGDRDLSSPNPRFIYRISALGYGPRSDIQALIQMLYRI
jgi:type IV pilus assembly protein PilX